MIILFLLIIEREIMVGGIANSSDNPGNCSMTPEYQKVPHSRNMLEKNIKQSQQNMVAAEATEDHNVQKQ